MMREPEAVQKSLIRKLPPGFALAKRGGVLDAIYRAFAEAFAAAEQAAAESLNELHPRNAFRLLEDFERVLGADPCGRDRTVKTLDERQKLAWQRWVATGGQSIPYFLALAKTLGYEIEIEEFWPSVAGVACAGSRLVPRGEEFVWIVHMKPRNVWHFRAGRNTAGEPLGGFDQGSLECLFRRLKPAHTQVVFYYDLGVPKPKPEKPQQPEAPAEPEPEPEAPKIPERPQQPDKTAKIVELQSQITAEEAHYADLQNKYNAAGFFGKILLKQDLQTSAEKLSALKKELEEV